MYEDECHFIACLSILHGDFNLVCLTHFSDAPLPLSPSPSGFLPPTSPASQACTEGQQEPAGGSAATHPRQVHREVRGDWAAGAP